MAGKFSIYKYVKLEGKGWRQGNFLVFRLELSELTLDRFRQPYHSQVRVDGSRVTSPNRR
jgi:hypothetical protein